MSIEVRGLTKHYGGPPVVDDVSLRIEKGELFVLLGPSGSGKSTLLRMIAGLCEVDRGRVLLHGRDITELSPKKRGIGFVFQNYALFRHMSVAENVEFALSVRKLPKAQRRARRDELLELVGLAGYGRRYPRQLSGGQQQRVALARALAHKPDVLLLDEPFGALDAKIRLDLRQALRGIQHELGLTSVFVTHDQEEAFELADRLAVLHEGRLVEIGTPQALYLRPSEPFVATFLGAANLVVGESCGREVRLGPVTLTPPGSTIAVHPPGASPDRLQRVQILFRPEDVEISRAEHGEHPRLGQALVETRTFTGSVERLRLRMPLLPRVRAVSPEPSFGETYLSIEAVRHQHESSQLPLVAGDQVWIAVRRFHVLAPASLRLLVEAGKGPLAAALRELSEGIAGRLGARLERFEPVQDGPAPRAARLAERPLQPSFETESGAEGFDIAVLPFDSEHVARLLTGQAPLWHHLLLVPGPARVPTRLLICVAVGEPGKSAVRFGERLAWQLGAEATVLTVLSRKRAAQDPPGHVRRFLDSCLQTLAARGVAVKARIRFGDPGPEIQAEVGEGGHDLLVMGAPLPTETRPFGSLGPLSALFDRPPACPLLIIQRRAKG